MRFLWLLLLPVTAFGQFAGVDNVTISSVSSGDEVTRWISNDYPDTSDPYPENYIYVDGGALNFWEPGAIPEGFEGIWIVHTNTTDASTVDASLVSFSIDGRAQVCVLFPDGAADPGWLAASSYTDTGRTISAGGNDYAQYCAMKDAGALQFGTSLDPMYLVTVGPAWRAQPTALLPPDDEAGFIVFSDSAYVIPENATTGDTIKFRRILSSVGAVTADVDDQAAGTTCSTADFNFAIVPTSPTATDPVTGSWGDGELGNIFLNVAMADLSADCVIVFEFENLTGGLQAYTERQTATVTILNADTPPVSADRFVEIGGSGSDANDCTTGSPCLTIARAAAVAADGDTIEIQVSGTGTGTYDQCTTITAAQSGGVGAEVTLRVRSGDTVNFYPSSGCTELLGFNGASYWKLDGSVGTMVIGDLSEWSNADAGTGYTHKLGIHGYSGANHIEISNVTVNGGGLDAGACNRIDQSTHHWYIHDSSFAQCGTNYDTAGLGNDGNDRGDLFVIAGEDHLIEDNTFTRGGHAPISVYAHDSVIRGNTLDSDWTLQGTTKPGSRAADYLMGSNKNRGTSPYGPTLIERNININTDASDNPFNPTVKLDGYRTIYRQNLHCNNDGVGFRLNQNNGGFDADHTVESQRIYHNTFVGDESMLSFKADRSTTLNNMTDMRFVNNLADNLNPIDAGDGHDNTVLLMYQDGSDPAEQGYPDDWLGMQFRSNWFHAANGEYNVKMKVRGGSTQSWPTNVGTQWPNVFISGNATTRATYVNSANCDFTGLALDVGSNGIGEGDYLTTVTAASSGTTVTLEDAWYFWVPADLSYYGSEAADYVEFQDAGGGNSRIRQIVSIDSQTQITVDSAVTVADGDEVRLVESDGTTVVDNMGAVQ